MSPVSGKLNSGVFAVIVTVAVGGMCHRVTEIIESAHHKIYVFNKDCYINTGVFWRW